MSQITSCTASPEVVTECGGDTFAQFEVTIENTDTANFRTVEWQALLDGQQLGSSQITVEPTSTGIDTMTVTITNSGADCLPPGDLDYEAEIVEDTVAFAPQQQPVASTGCGTCGGHRPKRSRSFIQRAMW